MTYLTTFENNIISAIHVRENNYLTYKLAVSFYILDKCSFFNPILLNLIHITYIRCTMHGHETRVKDCKTHHRDNWRDIQQQNCVLI